jgi:uncharacterized protein with FMN-binding domain
MRRAPIVLTATVAGMAAVLSFKAREPELPTASASAGTAATTTTPAPVPSIGSGGSKTATGDAISTRYGNAQVRVTVSNGKITRIEALQLQGNDPKSVQISGSAEPLLRQSALTKQSAAIDAVSGATITSASYEASLQSALDKLGFKAADGSRGTSTVPNVEEHDGGGPDGGFPPQP